MKRKERGKVKCDICKKEFKQKQRTEKYCSSLCAFEGERRRRKERVERGARDFAIRFEKVMRELSSLKVEAENKMFLKQTIFKKK